MRHCAQTRGSPAGCRACKRIFHAVEETAEKRGNDIVSKKQGNRRVFSIHP